MYNAAQFYTSYIPWETGLAEEWKKRNHWQGCTDTSKWDCSQKWSLQKRTQIFRFFYSLTPITFWQPMVKAFVSQACLSINKDNKTYFPPKNIHIEKFSQLNIFFLWFFFNLMRFTWRNHFLNFLKIENNYFACIQSIFRSALKIFNQQVQSNCC